MPLVSGQAVTRTFAAQEVLRNVDFTVNDGDRIGVTGANGTGKTTLLRLIVGLDEPNAGVIDRQRNVRLGYLPQDVPELLGTSLWDMLTEVFAHLRELEATLAELAHQMAAPDCPPAVLERYGRLQSELERQGGHAWHHRVEAVLTGLGFPPERWARPLAELSGGWRTRALLARLLLEKPDLLLLDEPTNSLDLDAVCWLEQFLQAYPGNLLIVSHDRFFLDKLSNRVWELGFTRLEEFKGNYTAYRRQRQERYDRRLKEWEAQQALIAKEEDFIRRNIAGQRTKEAQGRRTKLARYLEREAVAKPEIAKSVHFRFPVQRRTGDIVLDVSGLVAGYDPAVPLVRLPELRLERGQRLAIVGPNGTGKTTLLRTLAGDLPPLAGQIRYGSNVDLGYLRQHHDDLDPDRTLVDAIRQVQDNRSDAEARDILGGLLFSGDDAFKRVGELSGGQRARLAIARLAYCRPNLFFLDEPTNHLDIPTMESLQQALQAYDGTMIMVSHDRYLIQAVATSLLVLGDGEARFMLGSWEDYAAQREGAASAAAEVSAATSPAQEPEGKARYDRDRRRDNERKRQQRRYDELEGLLHELEDEKRMVEHAIGKAGEQQDIAAVQRHAAQLQAVTRQLEQLWDEYAKLADALDA